MSEAQADSPKPEGADAATEAKPSWGPVENIGETTEDERLWGMLAYFLFPLLIGAILGLVTKGDSKFVKFHSLQMIFTALAMFVISVVLGMGGFVMGFIPFVGFIVAILLLLLSGCLSLGCLILIIMSGLKANQGIAYRLPVIGNMAYKSAYAAAAPAADSNNSQEASS